MFNNFLLVRTAYSRYDETFAIWERSLRYLEHVDYILVRKNAYGDIK